MMEERELAVCQRLLGVHLQGMHHLLDRGVVLARDGQDLPQSSVPLGPEGIELRTALRVVHCVLVTPGLGQEVAVRRW